MRVSIGYLANINSTRPQSAKLSATGGFWQTDLGAFVGIIAILKWATSPYLLVGVDKKRELLAKPYKTLFLLQLHERTI